MSATPQNFSMLLNSSSPYWQCGRFKLPLNATLLMGIVNVTPDSFSDGGKYYSIDQALVQAQQLIDEGADLIDIGGESTRPGAPSVSANEELKRVLPVVRALAASAVPISVDTSKPEVMRAVLEAGAAVINDVRALQEPGALEAVAGSNCGLVLMHMQGTPRSMQQAPHYNNVVTEVREFLSQRLDVTLSAGISAERVVVDPGFGFGKTSTHNWTLLAQLNQLGLDVPVLLGLSRKSSLGAVTGRAVEDRVYASVAAALLAAQKGAMVLRVHDVAATRDALAVWRAMSEHE